MAADRPVVAVHGIWNRKSSMSPTEAAGFLSRRWASRLATGYQAASIAAPVPTLFATYYAYLIADQAQGAAEDLRFLTEPEKQMAWQWMRELGVPEEAAQGVLTLPLRQGLDWIARRQHRSSDSVARVMTAVLREVYVYLTRHALRHRVRDLVIAALETHQPAVVLAHSLGSVVAYEALHERPDLQVEALVTLGSPLGMPGSIFEALDPEPRDGRGVRPPGVRNWINIADLGDLVAVPAELGGRFDVDRHERVSIGFADFHTFGGYLASPVTAKIVDEFSLTGRSAGTEERD
jgi:pimeloyl-ACP methyl ester carboxylesterase